MTKRFTLTDKKTDSKQNKTGGKPTGFDDFDDGSRRQQQQSERLRSLEDDFDDDQSDDFDGDNEEDYNDSDINDVSWRWRRLKNAGHDGVAGLDDGDAELSFSTARHLREEMIPDGSFNFSTRRWWGRDVGRVFEGFRLRRSTPLSPLSSLPVPKETIVDSRRLKISRLRLQPDFNSTPDDSRLRSRTQDLGETDYYLTFAQFQASSTRTWSKLFCFSVISAPLRLVCRCRSHLRSIPEKPGHQLKMWRVFSRVSSSNNAVKIRWGYRVSRCLSVFDAFHYFR